MKTSIAKVSLCVILALAVILGGCRKKTDEDTEPADQANSTKQSISEPGGKVVEEAKEAVVTPVEAAVEVEDKVVEKVFSIVEQFNTDYGKSISDITAGAKEMATENLRKMAEKYRDVVAEKEQQLKQMTQGYLNLSDDDRKAAIGQIAKAGIDKIKTGLDIMKERFGVYYNVLKEKAGNLTGLDI
jgi:hypothetical protein